MNRQKKINCMTFTERKREIERAREEGGRRREKHIMEGRSKRTGKAEGRKSTMTPVEHSRSAGLGVSLCLYSTLKKKAFFKKKDISKRLFAEQIFLWTSVLGVLF